MTTEVPLMWILVVITFILFISSLYFNFKFIQNRFIKKGKKSATSLFCTSLIFFIISSVALLLWTIHLFNRIYVQDINVWITLVVMFLYIVQIYLLWLTLFMKTRYVFIGTKLRLSPCTVKCFTALFICCPILFILSPILYILSFGLGLAVIVAIFVIPTLSLTFLFVYKLSQIYKNDQSDLNDTVLSAMTRTCILGNVSLFSSVLASIILILDHDFLLFMGSFVFGLDMYTNYIFVIFSYSLFKTQYLFCCGCIDKKCQIHLVKMVNKMNNAHNLATYTQEKNKMDVTTATKTETASTTKMEATSQTKGTMTNRIEPKVPSLKNTNSLSLSLVENAVVKDNDVGDKGADFIESKHDFTVSIGDQQAVTH